MIWKTVILAVCMFAAGEAGATVLHFYTRAEMAAMQAAAETGDAAAMVKLGKAYADAETPNGRYDRASALYWFKKAADAGSAEAQRRLGDIYYDDTDKDFPRDEARAIGWYLRAAEKGDVFAQGSLGEIYGKSATFADYRKGYHWTLKAALQGDDRAVVRLRTAYVYKTYVAGFDEVIAKLTAEAETGNADARWRLASLFMSDVIGRKDRPVARALLERAAQQHKPEAFYLLADFYLSQPDGYPEGDNLRQGQALLRQAADQGYVPAQLKWADYYEPPHGIQYADDPVQREIYTWMADAAEKGYPDAQLGMGGYYLGGYFVSRDAAEAYKWLLLSQHYPYRRPQLQGTDNVGDHGPELGYQVEGRRRAEAWLAAHPLQYWQVEDARQ